jgi:uncharacterized membrane protein YagU involved in acid resistance
MMRRLAREGLLPGAAAGLAGGLVSGLALAQVGGLAATASLVRADATRFDFALHVALAALVGGGFGTLVWHQHARAGETLFWGLTYGAFWWFVGPLTLLPLLRAGFLAWDLHSAQEAFASLLGYLLYGATAGLSLAALRRRRGSSTRIDAGALARGALAGLAASFLVRATGAPVSWPGGAPVGGALVGIVFAWLYPVPDDGTGPGMIRGTVLGFFCWVAGPLSIVPLLTGGRLAWSVDDARAAFASLLGLLLLGALGAALYRWLDALARALFADVRRSHEQEGPGVEGLRAAGRGALAGLAGGLPFTLLIARIGGLAAAGRLIGSTSMASGLVVQFVVSEAVGITYGLLFRRQSYDAGSALGWGLAYGFLWWVLGPLTLAPVLLGARPQWTVEAAASLFPFLVGHLAYGAALGVVFHLLEARQNPWWIPRTRAEAARVARHRQQLLTSAPALWALVVMIALVIPVLLGR